MTTAAETDPLGPLAMLPGVWEGDAGTDVAPAEDRCHDEATSRYRERMTFEPIGMVHNHDQRLCGLRYFTMTWRTGAENAFHQDTGYWLWDASDGIVMRCFIVPRGVAVIAGARVAPDARAFELVAERGSPTFGICSNAFLDREFRTVRFTMKVQLLAPDRFAYQQDTVLEMPGGEPFHHTDGNTLRRVAS